MLAVMGFQRSFKRVHARSGLLTCSTSSKTLATRVCRGTRWRLRPAQNAWKHRLCTRGPTKNSGMEQDSFPSLAPSLSIVVWCPLSVCTSGLLVAFRFQSWNLREAVASYWEDNPRSYTLYNPSTISIQPHSNPYITLLQSLYNPIIVPIYPQYTSASFWQLFCQG